jgi:hypothetical protein
MYKYFVTSVLVFSLILFSEIDSNAQTEATPTPPLTQINVIQDIPINLPDPPNTQCTECPEDEFQKKTNKNFLSYAKGAFGNKFPFDIVGGIAGGNEGSCQNRETCTLKETVGNLLNLIRIPIWITFLINIIGKL